MESPTRGVSVVPTAIHLEEPRFPNGNPADYTQGTALKPSATDGGSHKMDSSQAVAVDSRRPSPPMPSRLQTDLGTASRPPMTRKSDTDRPRPKTQPTVLGKRKVPQASRPLQLGRQTTLNFEPYSDSSSEDEGEHPKPRSTQKDGNAERATHQKHEKQADHHAGPFSMFKLGNDHFNTKGRVSKRDGRLKISINETLNSGYFAKTLGAGLRKHFNVGDGGDEGTLKSPIVAQDAPVHKIAVEDDIMEDPKTRVRLNIVVIVIGSRGDIQPFLRIGKILKEDYGHRVRIATHPAFKKFVEEDSGLDFFSVGGNPSELMAFMVKNPGLIPSVDTIKKGEIGRRRSQMYDMFQGMWRACINSTDDENDEANMKMMGQQRPFVADAIIANPPSFAPPHIAERLGIPLHMMFTFPYTPTVQFPHPLANIRASNVDAHYTNFMSYPLVEMMTWQGLGDLINRFRQNTLMLEEVSTLWAPGQLYRLKVPYTYMWSPGLVPKPSDWGPEIDISGFVFLDLASSFHPPDDLVKFLKAGPPPVYIGFGSIVVDDPDRFTKLIFEAVEMAGVRALVSKGWGGLGDEGSTPDNVFMLDNTPHDWLFPKVSAVVHHGGAGTTAIGLKCGKPTMIVPFFGDQPFWGGMVAKKKAGAHECIPYKKLTAERLAEGIKQCLTDEAKKNAQEIADSIAKEGDGALNAVRSFHRSLPLRGLHNMRCQILPNRIAAWKLKHSELRLSPLAAELLVEWKKLKWNDLRLLRHYEWNDFGGPGEPITGIWGALVDTVSDMATGVGSVPVNMAKSVKKREKYYAKKHRLQQKRRQRKAGVTAPDDSNGATGNGVEKEEQDRPAGLQRQETTLSTLAEPDDYLGTELAQEAGQGVKKFGLAIVKAPMQLTLAITQGFHNAPRLYGDETVRRPPRVTGLHSGLRAGRDELIYGVTDGVSGLWMQPYRGARNSGVLGFFHGFTMGIGGFVLKDIAAILGPGAYTMKGLEQEALKKYQPTAFLRRARIAQGLAELSELNTRRISTADADEGGEQDGVQKRREIEVEVQKRWMDLQACAVMEKRRRRNGIVDGVLGRRQGKEGQAVPRKSTSSRAPTSRPTSAQPNGLANGTVPKQPSEQNMAAASLEAPDRYSRASGGEAKRQGVGNIEVPTVWQTSLQGNGVPVGGRDRATDRGDSVMNGSNGRGQSAQSLEKEKESKVPDGMNGATERAAPEAV